MNGGPAGAEQILGQWLKDEVHLVDDKLAKALECAKESWLTTVDDIRRAHTERRLDDVFPLGLSFAIQDALGTPSSAVFTAFDKARLPGITKGYKPSLLNYMRRYFKLASNPSELMVLPDHWPHWKQHWIEAYKNDGMGLKEGFLFMYELELILGSLMWGVFVGAFFSAVNSDMRRDFSELKVQELSFWVVTLGTTCVLCGLMQVMNVYITLLQLSPVSGENAYAFFKSQNVQNTMMVGNLFIVFEFYSAMMFVLTLLIQHNAADVGVSIYGVTIVLGIFNIMFVPFTFCHGTTFNIAMNAGLYGPKAVLPNDAITGCTPEEVDAALTRCALENFETYGTKPVPAYSDFYTSEADPPGVRVAKRSMKRPFRPFASRPDEKHPGSVESVM